MDEQLNYAKRDSITVKRNAKGEYAYDAKIYFNAEDGNEEVIGQLKSIDTELRAGFL